MVLSCSVAMAFANISDQREAHHEISADIQQLFRLEDAEIF
jgi:hypothetical protein